MNLWHFEYSFELDEEHRIVHGKIYGVWRKETAEAYREELKEAVKPLLSRPWAKLMDLSNWKTASRDVISVIGDLNDWCRNNNMAWTVYIIDNAVTMKMLRQMFDSGKYKDVAATVRTRPEGIRFLAEHGFLVNPESGGSTELFKN